MANEEEVDKVARCFLTNFPGPSREEIERAPKGLPPITMSLEMTVEIYALLGAALWANLEEEDLAAGPGDPDAQRRVLAACTLVLLGAQKVLRVASRAPGQAGRFTHEVTLAASATASICLRRREELIATAARRFGLGPLAIDRSRPLP